MPALVLLTPGTKVSLTEDHVVVQGPPNEGDERPEPQHFPLLSIDSVVTTDRISISMPALGAFMKREIPIIWIHGQSHRVLGICTPPPPFSTARWVQMKKTENPAFVRDISQALVAAKIHNQRRVLQRLAANRSEMVQPTLDKLEAFGCRAKRIAPGHIDELRGIEGAAAQEYFSMFCAFFPPDVPMVGRNRQPPRDPPNAVLSYAYTMLYAKAICAIHAVGLDPAIGFFHEPTDNRATLALDLIEPFRAPVADALALDLFSHRQLQPAEHFQEQDGGVYLNPQGRKKFHLAYERRMQRSFTDPRTDQHITLRSAIHNDALALKMALVEDRPFQPFRMP